MSLNEENKGEVQSFRFLEVDTETDGTMEVEPNHRVGKGAKICVY